MLEGIFHIASASRSPHTPLGSRSLEDPFEQQITTNWGGVSPPPINRYPQTQQLNEPSFAHVVGRADRQVHPFPCSESRTSLRKGVEAPFGMNLQLAKYWTGESDCWLFIEENVYIYICNYTHIYLYNMCVSEE